MFRPNGSKETIDSVLYSQARLVWEMSLSKEWGRLAQDNIHGFMSTYTIDFIHKHEVPRDRDVTYATYVLDHRPLKDEKFRVRITVGGNTLTYIGNAGSPAENLLEAKILINSIISDAKKELVFCWQISRIICWLHPWLESST